MSQAIDIFNNLKIPLNNMQISDERPTYPDTFPSLIGGIWSWSLKVIWKQLCVIEVILYRIVLLAFTGKVKQYRTIIKFQGCSHLCFTM